MTNEVVLCLHFCNFKFSILNLQFPGLLLMPPPRQTISFLQKRFREVGLEPDKRHGQNFLIDINLIDLLIRTADLGKEDVVLEIGTGTGSLTARMAELAAAVVTVEIDEHLHLLASEEP